MADKFLKYLEASKYFTTFPIKEICDKLKLQLIQDGHALTICSDIFVIDVDMSTLRADVLFVDEKLNFLSAHLNKHFEKCLKKRNALLFYVSLRHFMKYEKVAPKTVKKLKKNEQTEAEQSELDELLLKISPVLLDGSSCGQKLLLSDQILLCSCVLDTFPVHEELNEQFQENIFTHFNFNQRPVIKNQNFEIKHNSVYYKQERSPVMSFLWKNGFSIEEIFEIVVENKL